MNPLQFFMQVTAEQLAVILQNVGPIGLAVYLIWKRLDKMEERLNKDIESRIDQHERRLKQIRDWIKQNNGN